MSLYIRIKNGQPIEHPILESNFKQAFPNINTDNLPDTFAQFIRVEIPTLDVYQVYVGCTYGWDGDVVKDVHTVRDMTTEEIKIKQDQEKAIWAENGYASWVFNEETCRFDPPTPRPPGNYIWDEPTVSWVEVGE